MKNVTVYTMNFCPYCEMAKRLLKSKDIPFTETKVAEDDDATWASLEKKTGFKTMPQIFIGDHFVGGYRELSVLEQEGKLDSLLKS